MADSAEGLTFVLPVYNQAAHLEKVVNGWISALQGIGRPYDLILVDDGSTDDSPAIALKLASRHNRINVLTHPTHQGFGASIRTALEQSTQPLFFYTSGDPHWATADLARMLKSIEQKDEYTGMLVQIVNGHRRGLPIPAGRKRLRKLKSFFNRIVFGYWLDTSKGWLGREEESFWWRCRLQFGLRVGDINSAFKLFRRQVFDKMVLQSDGDFIHAEILAKANFLGTLMDEITLADKQTPGHLPDMSAERKRVFKNPQFRSPLPKIDEKPVEVAATTEVVAESPAVSSEPNPIPE
jgi:glycosyltransferase involved in cell wall biosynthesis